MAKIIQVIESEITRGTGVMGDVYRGVKQYWTPEGVLLAEVDPCPSNVSVPRKALLWLFGESGTFEATDDGKKHGAFWWRSEFRKRAGLENMPSERRKRVENNEQMQIITLDLS